MKVIFSKVLEEYYVYRAKCGMKDCSKKSIDKFYNRSRKQFPEETLLTQDMIDSWWKKRDSENNNSHAVRVCQILPFLRFVQERHPDSICIPKTPEWEFSPYTPYAYTEEELRRFFDACDNLKRPNNSLECKLNEIEFPVLFRLLFSTGMRTTEARLLMAKNVDLTKGIVYIEKDATKGYRERIVVLHDTMLAALRVYDKAVDVLVPERKTFFPNDKDYIHSSDWLSTHFKRIWEKAGNPKGAIAYDLRHHFIITNINSWVDKDYEIHSDLVTLSKYVGHSSVQRTYGYYAYVPQLGHIIESKSSARMSNIQTIKYNPDEEY